MSKLIKLRSPRHEHNRQVLDSLYPGDILVYKRPKRLSEIQVLKKSLIPGSHSSSEYQWGVFLDDEDILYLTTDDNATWKRGDYWKIAGKDVVFKFNKFGFDSSKKVDIGGEKLKAPSEVLKRAECCRENVQLLSELQIGDVVEIVEGKCSYWGIYVKDWIRKGGVDKKRHSITNLVNGFKVKKAPMKDVLVFVKKKE